MPTGWRGGLDLPDGIGGKDALSAGGALEDLDRLNRVGLPVRDALPVAHDGADLLAPARRTGGNAKTGPGGFRAPASTR